MSKNINTQQFAEMLGLKRCQASNIIRAGYVKAKKPLRDWIINAESAENFSKKYKRNGRVR